MLASDYSRTTWWASTKGELLARQSRPLRAHDMQIQPRQIFATRSGSAGAIACSIEIIAISESGRARARDGLMNLQLQQRLQCLRCKVGSLLRIVCNHAAHRSLAL